MAKLARIRFRILQYPGNLSGDFYLPPLDPLVTGSFTAPVLSVQGTYNANGSMTGVNAVDFLSLDGDLTALAVSVLWPPPAPDPLDIDLGFGTSLKALGLDLTADSSAQQSFQFTPQTEITLTFNQPVGYTLNSVPGNSSTVSFSPTDTLQLQMPANDSLTATANATLTGLFSNDTQLNVTPGLSITPLALDTPIGDADIGPYPLWSDNVTLLEWNNGVVNGGTTAGPPFAMGGFSSQQLGSFNIGGYSYPAPSITSLSPSSASAGSGDITLTAYGQNFVAGGNGTAGTMIYFNGSELTQNVGYPAGGVSATLPASDLASAGTFNVYVVNPPVSPGQSGSVPFTVVNSAPSNPVITELAPSSIVLPKLPYPLEVFGTGFANGATVDWNGVPLVTTNSASSPTTEVIGTIPASDLALGGYANITVVNGGNNASNAVQFTLNYPVPQISDYNLNYLTVGAGNTPLTIYGFGFYPTSTVTWTENGVTTALPIVAVSGDTMTMQVVVPGYLLQTHGTFLITVTDPAPGGGQGSDAVVVVDPLPTISAFQPDPMLVGSGDTQLTIYGTGFIFGPDASTVIFNGGQLAVNSQLSSPTQLVVTVPAADLANLGWLEVDVTNGSGSGNGKSLQIVYAPLNLTSLLPASATSSGPAFVLAVAGSGFLPQSYVTWTPTTGNSANLSQLAGGTVSQMEVQVPASLIAAAGTASITVQDPAYGGSPVTSNALPFTINQRPITLNALTPSTAIAAYYSVAVRLSGSGFTSDCSVYWNGSPVLTQYVSSAELKFKTPTLNNPGMVPVTVQNRGGLVSTNSLMFTIVKPYPVHLVTLELRPTSIIGGGSVSGEVVLSGSAPVGGAAIRITSSKSNTIITPRFVVVREGMSTASFTIGTTKPNSTVVGRVIATYGRVSRNTELTVNP